MVEIKKSGIYQVKPPGKFNKGFRQERGKILSGLQKGPKGGGGGPPNPGKREGFILLKQGKGNEVSVRVVKAAHPNQAGVRKGSRAYQDGEKRRRNAPAGDSAKGREPLGRMGGRGGFPE